MLYDYNYLTHHATTQTIMMPLISKLGSLTLRSRSATVALVGFMSGLLLMYVALLGRIQPIGTMSPIVSALREFVHTKGIDVEQLEEELLANYRRQSKYIYILLSSRLIRLIWHKSRLYPVYQGLSDGLSTYASRWWTRHVDNLYEYCTCMFIRRSNKIFNSLGCPKFTIHRVKLQRWNIICKLPVSEILERMCQTGNSGAVHIDSIHCYIKLWRLNSQ